jgi:hypothetical protein
MMDMEPFICTWSILLTNKETLICNRGYKVHALSLTIAVNGFMDAPVA